MCLVVLISRRQSIGSYWIYFLDWKGFESIWSQSRSSLWFSLSYSFMLCFVFVMTSSYWQWNQFTSFKYSRDATLIVYCIVSVSWRTIKSLDWWQLQSNVYFSWSWCWCFDSWLCSWPSVSVKQTPRNRTILLSSSKQTCWNCLVCYSSRWTDFFSSRNAFRTRSKDKCSFNISWSVLLSFIHTVACISSVLSSDEWNVFSNNHSESR